MVQISEMYSQNTNCKTDMSYSALIQKEANSYVVTFRDLPEALTCGDTLEEARIMAADALLTALEFYFEDRRPVPMPSKMQKGEELISLPPSVTAKVLLLNEMIKQNVSNAELARRLLTRPQDVQRLTNLRHATKIDAINAALNQLGKQLHISLIPIHHSA
ncbi:type II toxin-antitoxin system HicB family antitoxin [Snodgrassella alvi]|uniref:type II toxin-antitoxin system HicB family antitoxin n=1 Tax=Snodgrassella alvi TaxID=1196083 RepID=UPI001E3DA7D0|nr:type II toxin-antitoxin system HicB family antitoxin [Snodgrassella alvi]WLT05001.1 type II toxin-antitoxin system HicB family antitoxin [Snodgrassella alvi]